MRRPAWTGGCAAIAALAIGVAACGGGGSSEPKQDDQGTRPAKLGGKLTVLWANDIDQIDCGASYYQMDWMLCWATQRPLYSYEPQDGTKMVPDLAEGDPQVSEDGKTVTVKIRSGVKFSPPVNREVTTADVKYAIERGFFSTVNNGYAGAYFGSIEGAEVGAQPGSTIKGIEAPDDRTLVFHLTRATGGIFASGALAMPLTAPVAEEYAAPLDKQNPSSYGHHQLATGPYMIANDAEGKAVGYDPGRMIRLVRNPSWDKQTDYKPAYLDEIENRTGNTDTGVTSRRIVTGTALATGDFSPPVDVLKQVTTERKSQLILTPTASARWVSMNTTIKPFDDINVRKAVIAGFDRNALRLSRGGPLLGGMATHFLTPTIAGFDEAGGEAGPGYDFLNDTGQPMPDVSAAYFKKAGYPSGKYTGSEEILMVGSNAGVAAKAATITEQQFKEMGFKVTLRLVAQDTMYGKYCNVPAAKVAVCPNTGWLADFADGQTLLAPTFNGKNILKVNNSNWPQLDVPEINAAMEKAELLTDPAERAKAWAQIDRDITAQAPAIPWLWDNHPLLVSDDINAVPSKANGGVLDLNFTSLK